LPPPLAGLISAATNTTSMILHNGKFVPKAQKLWEQKDALLDTIKALLDAGANPNAKSDESPLHHLARRIPDDIRLPIARMLLEKGANPDAIDKQDTSPLQMAVLYKSPNYARLLLDYPVDINRLTPRGTALDIVVNNIDFAKRDIAARPAAAPAYEAELRDLDALLQLLNARGAKRKSELDIAPEQPKPEERHIASDFLKLVNTGEAEWALLALKAQFDAVSDAYFKFSKSKTRHQNVPLRPAADAEEIPPFAAVVKVKDSPWTLILCTIFYIRASHIKHIAAAAKELSESLKTHALTYSGTEETDYGNCELFDNGKSASKAAGKKSIALLTKEIVVLPAFYPARKGDNQWLSIEKSSINMVERADLVVSGA